MLRSRCVQWKLNWAEAIYQPHSLQSNSDCSVHKWHFEKNLFLFWKHNISFFKPSCLWVANIEILCFALCNWNICFATCLSISEWKNSFPQICLILVHQLRAYLGTCTGLRGRYICTKSQNRHRSWHGIGITSALKYIEQHNVTSQYS